MIKPVRFLWYVPIAATALVSACQFLSDGGTEIPNELTGSLYLPGGTPAINAQVTLYPVDYLSNNPPSGETDMKRSTRTDSTGRYSFSDMADGRYNVLSNAHDSLFSFRDSLLISGKLKIPSDTLNPPGSLTGKIQLREEDDPTTAVVQVVGTDYIGSVDSTGTFVLTNVAQGTYRMQLTTTLPNYAPSFREVTILSGQNDTLSEVFVPAHFGLDSSTVALWTFDSQSGNAFLDLSGNRNHLSPVSVASLEVSPFGFAVTFNGSGKYVLTSGMLLTTGPTGQITYEARIYLNEYPSSANLNGAAIVVGMREGPKLEITSDGRLVAVTQKQDVLGSTYLYEPLSGPGIVPLKRWTDVAIAVDEDTHQCYGYVDGTPVQLSFGFVNADSFRISTPLLAMGDDAIDNQPFIGKIDEIRISNSLILGAGRPLILK